MAQKVQVLLVDDLDGGEADTTLSFSFEGASYEIDLSSAHADEFRAAMAPWVKAGRKTTQKSAPRAKGSNDTGTVRAWAKAHGFEVSERGRISAEIRAAYNAAN